MSGATKGSLMSNPDLSPAAPQGGMEPPTYNSSVVSMRRRVPTNWVSGRTLHPSIESVVANSFVPSDFLVDSQVSGLGTVHLLLTLTSLTHELFLFMMCHVFNAEEEVVVIRKAWTPKKRRRHNACLLNVVYCFI